MKRLATEVSLFLNDTHIPYQDDAAIAAAVELVGYVKPATLFLNGDVIDFYALSRFDKDPARAYSLQDDINKTKAFLATIRAASPASQIVYIQGNHEARLRRYLCSQAQALASLDGLQLDKLLALDDYNITLVPAGKPFRCADFVVTHGDIVRKFSGYTAHGMLQRYGCSGASGHTHRAAKVTARNFLHTAEWVEGGCLCTLEPEYIEGVADWSHALTVAYTMDGHTQLDLIPIREGKLLYDGILFGGSNEGGEGSQAPG